MGYYFQVMKKSVKNPLSRRERDYVPGAIPHDLNNAFSKLQSLLFYTNPPNRALAEHHFHHADDVMKAVYNLADIMHNCRITGVSSQDLERKLEQLMAIFYTRAEEISYKVDTELGFQSNLPLLYLALFSLSKNGLHFINPDEGMVAVSVSKASVPKDSGILRDAVYRNPYAPTYGEFIRFAVHDDGCGFNDGKPPKDYLKLNSKPTEQRPRAGLPLVKLICKYLRSHLVIDSKPGDTTVAIYHPADIEQLPRYSLGIGHLRLRIR